jgi:hypothetical protein
MFNRIYGREYIVHIQTPCFRRSSTRRSIDSMVPSKRKPSKPTNLVDDNLRRIRKTAQTPAVALPSTVTSPLPPPVFFGDMIPLGSGMTIQKGVGINKVMFFTHHRTTTLSDRSTPVVGHPASSTRITEMTRDPPDSLESDSKSADFRDRDTSADTARSDADSDDSILSDVSPEEGTLEALEQILIRMKRIRRSTRRNLRAAQKALKEAEEENNFMIKEVVDTGDEQLRWISRHSV